MVGPEVGEKVSHAWKEMVMATGTAL